VDVNIADDQGRTCLHLACSSDQTGDRMVAKLLAAGVDKNAGRSME